MSKKQTWNFFRTESEGSTLREHLELSVTVNLNTKQS